jgi:hypothetical protein
MFNGGSAQNLYGQMTGASDDLNNVYFIGGGSKTFNANASTTDFTIDATSGTVQTASHLSIGGNYTNNGTLDATTNSTVVLIDGTTQQTFTGNMTDTSAFYDIEITNAGGANPDVIFSSSASTTNSLIITTASVQVQFQSTATSTFTNIDFDGQGTGTRVEITSSTGGSAWGLIVTGSQSVYNTSFADTYACDGDQITALISDGNNDAGGNSCILFAYPAITISGILYNNSGYEGQNQETGVATTTVGIYSTTTDSGSGAWQITDVLQKDTWVGVPIFVWVDNDASFRAFVITKASSTAGDITGLDLYEDRVAIRHEGTSATSTTYADMSLYDGDNDPDIQFTANGNVIDVSSGSELHIWAGSEFEPGDNITVNLHGNSGGDVDGNLHLDTTATSSILTLGSSSGLTLAGSWYASSTSIFNPGSNTATFNATTSGKEIIATSTPFYNITFNGSSGGWTFNDNASTTNNFTITTGSVTAPSGELSISKDYSNSGSFDHNSGTVLFDGSTAQAFSNQMIGTDDDFYNLTFLGGGTKTFNNNASTSNNFIIDSTSGTVVAPSLLTIGGNYTNNGDFDANTNSNTLMLSGSGKDLTGQMTGIDDLYNVLIIGSYTFQNSASTTNDLTINSGGTLTGSADYLSVSADYTNNGDFAGNSGTLMFNGGSAQTLYGQMTGTSDDFNNLYFMGAGSKTFNANASTTNDFTIDATSGTVQAPSLMTIAGHYTNNGDFDANTNSNTLYFTGTTKDLSGEMTGTDDFYNLIFTGSYTFQNSASTTNALTINSGATLTGSSDYLSIAGNYTNTGDFSSNSGTVMFDGGSAQTLNGQMTGAADDFNNLYFIGGGNKVFNGYASTTGDFTIDATSGTVQAPSLMTIAGNYTNNGDFDANTDSGILYFSGTGNLSGEMTGTDDFYDLVFLGAYTFQANASTSGDFIINSGGSVVAPSGHLSISGHYNNTAGDLDANSGTIIFDGSSGQNVNGQMTGTSDDFNNLYFMGAGNKVFNPNASTTGDFTIDGTSGTVQAPSLLTIGGNYSNSSNYNANGGTIFFTGSSKTLSGQMIGLNDDFYDTVFIG